LIYGTSAEIIYQQELVSKDNAFITSVFCRETEVFIFLGWLSQLLLKD